MKFLLKLSDKLGNALLNIPPNKVKDEPSFTWKKGGSPGEINFELGYRFQEIPSEIVTDSILDVFVYGGENPNGMRVFRGIISKISPFVKTKEGIGITAFGLAYALTFSHFKNGSSFSVAKTGDPSQIIRDVIDHANSTFPSDLISYTAASVTNTGKSSELTFNTKTHREAIDHTTALSPDGWNWILDANGLFTFRQKPSSATHSFTVGKDIEALDAEITAEDKINSCHFKYSGGSQDYSSISSGEFTRENVTEDTQITNSATALAAATKLVEEGKANKKNIKLTINRNYDLESIKPGDTCRVQNIPDNNFLGNNMEIVSVQYGLDRVVLELETVRYDIGRDIKAL